MTLSKKTDYNDAEWKAISAAPVAAGMFITLSDASGPVGIAKEAMALGKALSDSAGSSQACLVYTRRNRPGPEAANARRT